MLSGCGSQAVVVQSDDRAEQLLPQGGDSPAAAAGDFGDQAADVQALYQAGDALRLTLLLAGVMGLAPEELADIGVAEAPQMVFSSEHGLEQPHVVAPRGVEAGVGTPAGDSGFGQVGWR